MKKIGFLVCSMILVMFSAKAKIYTLDLQSGTLTLGASDTAPERIVEQTELGFNPGFSKSKHYYLNEESIISEDRVWMYARKDFKGEPFENRLKAEFNVFKGTITINEKEYHQLYSLIKEEVIESEMPSQAEIDEATTKLNEIPEFDFENLNPKYYIRQEGEKYYMLWADEYFNNEGEVIGKEPSGQYGSNIRETLIYDFSVEPGQTYCLLDAQTKLSDWYLAPEIEDNIGFNRYNNITVCGNETIESEGKEYILQIGRIDYTDNDLPDFDAIKDIGNKYSLALPGVCEFVTPDYDYYNFGLVNVRQLNGNYIYGESFSFRGVLSSVDSIAVEESETEYFSIDGRRIYGKPLPGIYIVRRGADIRKVIIK